MSHHLGMLFVPLFGASSRSRQHEALSTRRTDFFHRYSYHQGTKINEDFCSVVIQNFVVCTV